MLNVPHIKQHVDGFCLPACAQMVLAFYDVQTNQVQLARQMGVVVPTLDKSEEHHTHTPWPAENTDSVSQ